MRIELGGLIAKCDKCGKTIDPREPPYIPGLGYLVENACSCWFKGNWINVPVECLFVVKERRLK